MTDTVRIIGIGEDVRREDFDCGVEALNVYLQRYARQNHENNIARSFVAVDQENRVLGYYSVASASIEFESLPEDHAKRLPKYPVPAVRIARLAVYCTRHGQGIGARLLVDALKRILAASADIGIKVVLVDAKNETARQYYRHYGFVDLRDVPMTLFLSVDTLGCVVAGKVT